MSYPVLGAIPSLYIFELWSVSVSAVDVLADGGISYSAEKAAYCINSGSTPIYRYWQMGLALFSLILGGNSFLGFSPGKKSHSFESISGVLRKFWLLVSRFLLNVIPGLIAWEFTDICPSGL